MIFGKRKRKEIYQMATQTQKKLRLKPCVWDTAFFIGGLIMGRLIGALTVNITFLRWLAYEVAFGVLDPVTIDLVLFKFTFGFGFYLTPAVVIFTILFVVGGKLIRTQVLTPPPAKAPSKPVSEDTAIYYDN